MANAQVKVLRTVALVLGSSLLLSACGGGESSSTALPDPPQAPTWSLWSGSAELNLDGAIPYESYQAFGSRDGDLMLLATAKGSAATPQLVRYYSHRYQRQTGWGPASEVTRGTDCPVFTGNAAAAYLAQPEVGGLVYQYGAGWKCLPASPPSSAETTPLSITVASDKRILGSRIAGVPTAVAQLELFELKAEGWASYKSIPIAPVQNIPAPYTGRTPLFWGPVMAHEYASGIVAATHYAFSALPSTQIVRVELATDAGQSLPLTGVNDGGGYIRTVGASGALYAYGSTRVSSTYQYRLPGAWSLSLTDGPHAPVSTIKPTLVTSPEGELFVPGCVAGKGFCEGSQLVELVNATSGSRRSAADMQPFVMSENGILALFSTGTDRSISYRLGVRSYSEPEVLLGSERTVVSAHESGPNRQYIATEVTRDGKRFIQPISRAKG